MHRLRASIAALLVAALGISLAPTASAAQSDSIHLALIPPEGIGTGDQDSLAVAEVDIRAKEGTLCADLDTEGLGTPFTADIHRRGDGDPVVVSVFENTADPDPSGCVAADPVLLREMLKDRFGFYLDIHTAKFPDGELSSGNLVEDVVSRLDGDQVVPGPGDADGAAVAWVVTFDTCCPNLFVFVNTTNVTTPITVELRRGPAGTDGDLVATVVESSDDPDGGGSITVDRKVIRDIDRDPGAFYLEVINPAFPDGAIRGQLLG